MTTAQIVQAAAVACLLLGNLGMLVWYVLMLRQWRRLNQALGNLAVQAWLVRGYPADFIASLMVRLDALHGLAQAEDAKRAARRAGKRG